MQFIVHDCYTILEQEMFVKHEKREKRRTFISTKALKRAIDKAAIIQKHGNKKISKNSAHVWLGRGRMI